MTQIFITFSRSMMQLPLSSVCQRLPQIQGSLMIRRHVQCGATGSWPSGQVLRTCLIPVHLMERKRRSFCETAGQQISVENSQLLTCFRLFDISITVDKLMRLRNSKGQSLLISVFKCQVLGYFLSLFCSFPLLCCRIFEKSWSFMPVTETSLLLVTHVMDVECRYLESLYFKPYSRHINICYH